MARRVTTVALMTLAGIISLSFSSSVLAARYTSTSYTIDASVDDSFGGQNSSTSYKLVDAGGEALIGNGTSGSYMIGLGYTAQLVKAIQVNVAQTSLSFAALTPGTPQTVQLDVQTQTDASGYNLAVMQNGNLNDGASHTISPISGTIASPAAWTNGTTKGLGFTIVAAPGGIPGVWNGGNSYAQFPGTSTSFFTRSGIFSGTDTTSLRLKLDVPSTQTPGSYTNTLTTTGTITP